jgi:phytoene synthase
MSVDESYAYCERVARTQAKNFYYSFLLLSKPRRQAMCAIYAFMRYCDDLSDEAGIADRRGAIANWRRDLEAALAGSLPEHALWPAFADAVQRYNIPHEHFFEMIDGVSSDLEPRRMRTFDELYGYCYQVASVVGLTIIHIFGFANTDALKLAEKCGIAFQLTNIIRDVREDAENGRVYLPEDDLARFGVAPESLRGRELTPALRQLLAFEADRARAYYRESAPLIAMIDSASRPSLRALIGIYSCLLDRVTAADYQVLRARLRVPTYQKIWILMRSRW